MQNIIQSFILYLSSWSRRRNIHQDRYSWSFQACWCNSPVSCSFRYSEHIHRCLSQNNQKKASAQINQNENMHKTRKTLGALSPSWLIRVAQLVVAQLVCRSVDWRLDIYMSEISDIHRIWYFRCKYWIYVIDINRRYYIVPTLLWSDHAHRCKSSVNFLNVIKT